MKDNVAQIRKIPIILRADSLSVDKTIKAKLGPKFIKEAARNSKKIFAYRIVYKSQGHKVVGYIVEPRKGKGKLPCVIWNRGGSRDFGAVMIGHLFVDMFNIAALAIRGYIVIITQYSGNAGGEGVDEFGGSDIDDVLNLREILKKYPRADISRIGMYGASRGGLMTYLALSKVKWIKAAAVMSAPSDEVNAPKFRKGWSEHQKQMYGGSLEEKIRRSAIYWPEKFCATTPLLIMCGTADWRVNPQDSIRLAEKLLENMKPFRLEVFEGGDHSLSEFTEEKNRMIFGWFDKYLKDMEKLPDLKPHGK